MFDYPYALTSDDNGTVMLTFPDFPEAVTFGDTEDEARLHAVDALETAMQGRISDRQDIPFARASTGATVAPSLLAQHKLLVYQAMRARGWRKADLARELSAHPTQVDRLLSLRHATPIAQLEQAYRVCGRRVVIETRELAAA